MNSGVTELQNLRLIIPQATKGNKHSNPFLKMKVQWA